MTQSVKQSRIENITSDAGPNRAGLFVRASGGDLLAKLGRDGDFYNRFAH